jgi:hypothetical protein
MSIQKKSLINTLKSAKKANVVKEEVTVSGAIASPAKFAPRVLAAKKFTASKFAGSKSAAKKLGAAKTPRIVSTKKPN